MGRSDPLNDRQLEVLRRLGADQDLSHPQDVRFRTSARVLQGRGLVKVSRRDGGWQAALTEAGRFYLDHGHHPDQPGDERLRGHKPEVSPDEPAAEVPGTSGQRKGAATQGSPPTPLLAVRRQAAAVSLIRRLEAETSVTIDDPDEDTVTEWRRIIDFAKRHGLVPAGTWIEKRRDWGAGLTIELKRGDPPNKRVRSSETLAVPVASRLRSPHPVVARLRDDGGRLVMPAARRCRCLLILQALAAEAERRGHTVTDEPVPEHRKIAAYTSMGRYHPSHYTRREGEIRVGIGEFSYVVTLSEENPQSSDPERSQRLVIEVPYRTQGRQYRWADRKTSKVEERLGTLLQELETRAVEDTQHKIDEEQAKADRHRRWKRAMAEAHRLAYEEHNAAALRDQAKRWRETQDITGYCEALAERLEREPPDSPHIQQAQEWLSWARARAIAIDPLRSLPTAPEHPELTPEDLKPYLKGWSPYGPEGSRPW
ncbi:MAG TPA: hypothetical protein VGS19_15505 [Streptosporangiaceae bacterium]|nr:hypothetical protein [Streptosporangiaceae bacterium]